jgi:small conductance mechanosensitive channel
VGCYRRSFMPPLGAIALFIVSLSATKLNSPDNLKIIAANSPIYSSTIKNHSANDTLRSDSVTGVSYGDELGKAAASIHHVSGQDARVLKDPALPLAVSELADSSDNFVVRPWCKKEDYWALRFDLTR